MFVAWSRLLESYKPVNQAESSKANLSLGNGEADKDVTQTKNKRTKSHGPFYLVLGIGTRQQFRISIDIVENLDDFQNRVNQNSSAPIKYSLTNKLVFKTFSIGLGIELNVIALNCIENLAAMNGHLARSFNTQSNLIATNFYNDNCNVVINDDTLILFSR